MLAHHRSCPRACREHARRLDGRLDHLSTDAVDGGRGWQQWQAPSRGWWRARRDIRGAPGQRRGGIKHHRRCGFNAWPGGEVRAPCPGGPRDSRCRAGMARGHSVPPDSVASRPGPAVVPSSVDVHAGLALETPAAAAWAIAAPRGCPQRGGGGVHACLPAVLGPWFVLEASLLMRPRGRAHGRGSVRSGRLGSTSPPGAAPGGHGGVHHRRRAPASARTGGVGSQGLGFGSGSENQVRGGVGQGCAHVHCFSLARGLAGRRVC